MIRVNCLGQKIKIKILYNVANMDEVPQWQTNPPDAQETPIEAGILKCLRYYGARKSYIDGKAWYIADEDCMDVFLPTVYQVFTRPYQSPCGNRYRLLIEVTR